MADVWDDLFGENESTAMRIKAQLFGQVFDQVKVMNETKSQTEIAAILGLKQPHVSEILRGKMGRFSLEKLIELAGKVSLVVSFSTTLKS